MKEPKPKSIAEPESVLDLLPALTPKIIKILLLYEYIDPFLPTKPAKMSLQFKSLINSFIEIDVFHKSYFNYESSCNRATPLDTRYPSMEDSFEEHKLNSRTSFFLPWK